MGIVVCVAMALGLIAFMPMPWREPDSQASDKGSFFGKLKSIAPLALTTVGAWNTLWYGLQNSASFWGMTGLITGVIMMLSAMVLTTQVNHNKFWQKRN